MGCVNIQTGGGEGSLAIQEYIDIDCEPNTQRMESQVPIAKIVSLSA